MSRHLFKLFNLARPSLKFARSTLTISKPAKLGSLMVSSTLLGLMYMKSTFESPIQTGSDWIEVETISAHELKDGEMKEFQVGPTKDDIILLSKVDGKYYASGAKCTHFGFNLAKGVLFDDKVICPLHAAAFSVTSGAAEQGPAFDGIPTFPIREHNGKLLVKVPKHLEHKEVMPMVTKTNEDDRKFVILGAGPAALSAAETLRQSGYAGDIILITNESEQPYDRTILTKNLFKVQLPHIRIRDQSFYERYGIKILTDKQVIGVDTATKVVKLENLDTIPYDRLLVATGGRPRVPRIPGVDLRNVFTIRKFSDIENLREAAKSAKDVVIIGGSFIGMETAANFKSELKDNVNITVVDMNEIPFASLGKEVGSFYKNWYEQNGVKFSLGKGIRAIEGTGEAQKVVLADGTELKADIVVLGVGIQPNSEPVASSVKLAHDHSIETDQYLKTSDGSIYAAGDVASVPRSYVDRRDRIEHYNEAIQQGMIAAYNMLDKKIAHESIPFFWTRQFEKSLQYTGYGNKYDEVYVHGDPNTFSFTAYYGLNNKVVASASMGRFNAAMIINQAMQVGVMPSFDEIKSGKVTVEDIQKRVQANKGGSRCSRRQCQNKKYQSSELS